jgi:hypothetical protein
MIPFLLVKMFIIKFEFYYSYYCYLQNIWIYVSNLYIMWSRVSHLVIRGLIVARCFIFKPTGVKRRYVNGEVIPVHDMKAYASALDDHFTSRPIYPFERTPEPSGGWVVPSAICKFRQYAFQPKITQQSRSGIHYIPRILRKSQSTLTRWQDVAAGHYRKPD